MIDTSNIRSSKFETIQTFLHDNKKNIRHIKKATLFSLGASQLIGAIAATTALVALVGNTVMTLLALPFCKTDHGKDRLINQLGSLKDNVKELVAASISTIPLVGVLGSGLFLAATGDLQNAHSPTFFSKVTEAYSHTVLGRLPLARFGLLKAMYPLRNINYDVLGRDSRTNLNGLHTQIGTTECKIPVDRKDGQNHVLNTHFINTTGQASSKTMVLFHGNGMTGEMMTETASYYKYHGWNVLMMTFGGYPGCDEGVSTTEATTIQDVHAVLRHLEAQGVEKIGVHGLSKGASVAMHATQLSSKVCYAALEMPYTSVADVAGNLIKNVRMNLPIAKYLPVACARGVARSAIRAGERVLGVKDKSGNTYYTDGCDNVKKARQFKGVFVTLGGSCDFLMGRALQNQLFSENFSLDLYKAHVEANPQAKDSTAFTQMQNVQHCGLQIGLCDELLKNALSKVE